MVPDLPSAMLRRVQRLSATPSMAAVARQAETQLRNAIDVPMRQFVTACYPVSFVTGKNISISVLQWLFPVSERNYFVVDDAASPLGELTQIFLITNAVMQYLSAEGHAEALEVVLAASVFVKDSELMTEIVRQQALDHALRCAVDEDTIELLLAHGADPQAVAKGYSKSPLSASDPILEDDASPIYLANGVFLIANRTLMPSYLRQLSSLDYARSLLRAGVDPVSVLHSARHHHRVDVLNALIEDAYVDIDCYAPEDDSTTALMKAVTPSERRLEVVRALLQLGATVSEAALQRATAEGNESILEQLQRHASDINL